MISETIMNDLIFNGIEVLIVEDDFINFSLIKELICYLGLKHHWAKNGREAVEILANNENISLVLMDINMPEMDGIAATKKIRESNVAIPIIFQTAYDSDENRKECFEAGGNEFMSKPMKKEMLYSLLKKYLAKSQITQK